MYFVLNFTLMFFGKSHFFLLSLPLSSSQSLSLSSLSLSFFSRYNQKSWVWVLTFSLILVNFKYLAFEKIRKFENFQRRPSQHNYNLRQNYSGQFKSIQCIINKTVPHCQQHLRENAKMEQYYSP